MSNLTSINCLAGNVKVKFEDVQSIIVETSFTSLVVSDNHSCAFILTLAGSLEIFLKLRSGTNRFEKHLLSERTTCRCNPRTTFPFLRSPAFHIHISTSVASTQTLCSWGQANESHFPRSSWLFLRSDPSRFSSMLQSDFR